MYSTNHGFRTYDHMLFDGENGTESFSPEYFAEHSEHVVLMDYRYVCVAPGFGAVTVGDAGIA